MVLMTTSDLQLERIARGKVRDVYAVDGDRLLLHGSTGAGALRHAAAGAKVAVSAYLLDALVIAEAHPRAADISFGLALRAYRFDYLSEPKKPFGPVEMMVASPETVAAEAAPHAALAEGVFFTRDLVTEPANILYPQTFADRCHELSDHGVEVFS